MFAAVGSWLINTRLGQSLILAAAIVAAVAITYNVVEQRGYDRCKGEWNASIADANEKTIEEQNERDETSSDVSQDTRAKNEEDTKAVDRQADKTKETVNDVYDQPPRTQPVAYGSCVHPVDQRVQDEFERSYREANTPTR